MGRVPGRYTGRGLPLPALLGPAFLAPALLALALLPGVARGQEVLEFRERLDFDRPEAWAMKYFSSVAQPTGFGAPESRPPGALEVGLEAGWVPALSEEERRVGFNGSKVEDLNKTSAFGRLRLSVGLPADFSLSLGWVPPVEVGGVETNLYSLALARPLLANRFWSLGLRLHAQRGTLEGDITCTREEARLAPGSPGNPFGCEGPSRDRMTVRQAGLELAASFYPEGEGRLVPHLAVTVSYLDPEFQVDAVYSGLRDRTLETTHGTTWSLAGGLTWAATERTRVGVEAFYAPLDIVRRPGASRQSEDLWNARALVRVRVR